MDWTKIGALANIGCLVVAVVALGYSFKTNSANPWIPALIAAFGGFVCYSLVLWRKFQRIGRLPFKLLASQCLSLISDYKKLAFDNPQEARFPLNPASFPNYGVVWEYHDVLIYQYKFRLFEFLCMATKAYEAHGVNDYPDAIVGDTNTVIVDLIASLEALNRNLERRA